MKASRKTKRGVFGATVLAGVLLIGGYALTNVITFQEASTLAGAGGQTVQVQAVQDIDYTLNTTDRSVVDAIAFTISAAVVTGATDGVAWIKNADDLWYSCGAVADGAVLVTCNTAGPGYTAGGGTTLPINTIGVNNDGTTAAPLRLVLSE